MAEWSTQKLKEKLSYSQFNIRNFLVFCNPRGTLRMGIIGHLGGVNHVKPTQAKTNPQPYKPDPTHKK